jgi:enamine deaminase RidA (YjgF/YER057c/UK114 family)
MRTGLDKIDSVLAKAGADETRFLDVRMRLDERDFDGVNKVWDARAQNAHAPARSSGKARMAKRGLLVELIVNAVA